MFGKIIILYEVQLPYKNNGVVTREARNQGAKEMYFFWLFIFEEGNKKID